jgi:hypothetical protein
MAPAELSVHEREGGRSDPGGTRGRGVRLKVMFSMERCQTCQRKVRAREKGAAAQAEKVVCNVCQFVSEAEAGSA